MSKADIESLLKQAFSPTYLNVVDDGARHIGHPGARLGGHFNVEISADVFKDKKPVETHRMIYAALAPVSASIHALGIKVVSNG